MNIKSFTPMIRAALISMIVLAIGWTGLDIPRDAVEQTIDGQLDSVLEQMGENDSSDNVSLAVDGVRAQVTQVVDGDTAIVMIDDQEAKLRFIGIDTPETQYSPAGAECYGAEASVRARELLQDQTVILRSDDTQATKDVHGRLLVYAELPDERDFGAVMLAEGFAHEYTYAKDYVNQSLYQQSQSAAQTAGLGLWSACE